MASVLVLYHRSNLNPRIELFCEALLEDGYDVEAICWDRGGSTNEGTDVVPAKRVATPGFDMSLLNVLVVPLLYIQFVRAMWRRDADIILCGHIALLPLAVVWGLATRSPVVYDVIETYFEGYRSRSSMFAEAFATIASGIERICLRVVDGITVIDTTDDRLADRYRGYTTNFAVVYNLPKLKPKPERPTENEVPVVVYAGLIDDRKGVPTLLEAFATVRQTHEVTLRLVGDSVDDTLARLQQQAVELGIEDSVEFTGRVEYDAVHDQLVDADVAVAPYRRLEVFEISRWNSRKIPDYMNAGLPMIAPNFGGFPEIIEATGSGITVDTDDAGALADGITSLVEDPEWAREMGQQGRSAVEERYNWGREREKILDVVGRVRE